MAGGSAFYAYTAIMCIVVYAQIMIVSKLMFKKVREAYVDARCAP